jgi:hypothetical protein
MLKTLLIAIALITVGVAPAVAGEEGFPNPYLTANAGGK